MPSKLITYTGILNDVYYNPKEIDTRQVIGLVRQAGAIPQQLLPFKGIFTLLITQNVGMLVLADRLTIWPAMCRET